MTLQSSHSYSLSIALHKRDVLLGDNDSRDGKGDRSDESELAAVVMAVDFSMRDGNDGYP